MVVCDSAPLIHLSRVGELRLLRDVFQEISIPTSVYREVVEEAKKLGKPGVRAIEQAIEDGWIEVVEVEEKDEIKRLARSERIEIEDAEVLYLAKSLSTRLVTSDGWLIKVAKTQGVDIFWTTTLVLLAIKNGDLSKKDGKHLLRDLASSGLYLKADVYATLIDAIEDL